MLVTGVPFLETKILETTAAFAPLIGESLFFNQFGKKGKAALLPTRIPAFVKKPLRESSFIFLPHFFILKPVTALRNRIFFDV
ncbi:MAG: hypothetical protein OI74_10715 [Gammaproteobacteria bacterium (ex Lamellibrachia satsuma)]|nr:MAG: hypothetical protein OI74_10715 [Gammaproteobacteria bacterium (ex Lamellibrachia satsuma)]RRS37376.1 MAG: hypothetical protein NV67_01835 [Gammaproteobacteria bacterium (ex Lamellibrachia satsuma)]